MSCAGRYLSLNFLFKMMVSMNGTNKTEREIKNPTLVAVVISKATLQVMYVAATHRLLGSQVISGTSFNCFKIPFPKKNKEYGKCQAKPQCHAPKGSDTFISNFVTALPMP